MVRLIVSLFSRLSLTALYRWSDWLLFPLIYYVVRYRRRITRLNLTNSFPDKTAAEIVQLEKQFYHHFADVIVEIIWSYRATHEQMREHIHFENVEAMEQWTHLRQGTVFMLGHMGNWEWLPEIQQHYQDPAIQHYNVYRRQKNAAVDRLMLQLREQRSGKDCNIEKNDLVRRLIAIKHSGRLFTLGLVSDQKASPKNVFHRTMFLHQDTGFLGGGEVLSRKLGFAVCYLNIVQFSRGVYRCRFDLITTDPASLEQGELTERYARQLEQNIREQPFLWLWTHNRWKWEHLQQ